MSVINSTAVTFSLPGSNTKRFTCTLRGDDGQSREMTVQIGVPVNFTELTSGTKYYIFCTRGGGGNTRETCFDTGGYNIIILN